MLTVSLRHICVLLFLIRYLEVRFFFEWTDFARRRSGIFIVNVE